LRPRDSTPFSIPPISSRPASASAVLYHGGSLSSVFAKLTKPPSAPASFNIVTRSPDALVMPMIVRHAPRTIAAALSTTEPLFVLVLMRCLLLLYVYIVIFLKESCGCFLQQREYPQSTLTEAL